MDESTDAAPTIEVTVGAPVEAVWPSLRDPDLIRRWMGWHYDGLDEEIKVIFATKVTADDETHVLQLGDGDRFEVEAVEGGTRVRVTRAPYRPGEEWSAYYDEITEGWTSFLQQLKFMHEQHPETERRTLFLAGRGEPGALDRLRETVPATQGERWFSSAKQDGFVLPHLGPGLLITAAKDPASDDSGQPAVETMAIITTYGLDDEQFAAERDRWTQWWRGGYPDAEPATI